LREDLWKTMSEKIKRQNHTKRIRERIRYALNCLFRYSQRLLEWMPCKSSRICFVTLTRKGYVDNMRCVAQALKERNANLDLIWITKYPGTCSSASDSGIRVIPYHTLRHFYLQFTSGLLISDDSLYHGLIRRKKQVYLNVWHGGINYKRLGREGISFEDSLMEKIFVLKNPCPDYMVAGSRFFAENMKTAFGFDRTVFLECGLPRNDVIFHNALLQGNVKRFYGIEDKKVILYAPTFREQDDSSFMDGIDFEKLIEAAQERYEGKWVVLYRAHYFVRETSIRSKNVINVSDYADMQEILIDTELLISDYSSCMWDFSFLYRPIIVYAPDERDYCEKERGLTEAGKSMPYPKARSMGDLIQIIEDHDFAADVQKVMEHHKEMGAYETGDATGYITDFVISKMNKRQGTYR
jgi:CDP-glycerol glycerophosphotransferase